MGVSAKSIVKNENELREQVSYIINKYRQPALIETYVEGREITVGMVGNLIGPVARRMPVNPSAPRIQAGLYFLPPMEVNLKPFETTDTVYSNRLKVALAEELDYLAPAPIDDDTIDELNWLAAAVFRVMGALDVARVDFRMDMHDNEKPYILEINPLPGLSSISDLVIEARADDIDQGSLINMILEASMKRYGLIE
jgi:D-alanine-D-alanine ligase